ncbi:MAG TPA: hypothetical protein VFO11_13145 [Candidatus Polarisedimenticolaceae bacterium]|nr:hypothetical protein [Candidatus Polarisedimenticolaceae bacterium]
MGYSSEAGLEAELRRVRGLPQAPDVPLSLEGRSVSGTLNGDDLK